MYDTIIIGSGPAGVSASLYIRRAGFKVLIISKNEGALTKTDKIDNNYGFEKTISGKELLENGIKQAERLGVEIVNQEVISIKYNEENFEVIVANQSPNEKYTAKTIVIATGANRNKPSIKGTKEFEGKGISYCAVCDAFFYRNKDVAVLGNGDYALGEIEELLPVVKSVTMLTDGKDYVENRAISEKVNVNTKPIEEFRGTDKIEEIEFKDKSTQKVNGVFIALGVANSLDFAQKLGARVENGNIVVNDNMETTVKNVYACGDCTGGILQISKAVYDGTKAGLAIINTLRSK